MLRSRVFLIPFVLFCQQGPSTIIIEYFEMASPLSLEKHLQVRADKIRQFFSEDDEKEVVIRTTLLLRLQDPGLDFLMTKKELTQFAGWHFSFSSSFVFFSTIVCVLFSFTLFSLTFSFSIIFGRVVVGVIAQLAQLLP
jgi:hypothetical protein